MPDRGTNLLAFLEQAGRGCISGQVIEWPQLKPACAWAANEIKRLRGLIAEHNADMESQCQWKQESGLCDGYIERGRRCPDCPKDDAIDAEA